MAITAEERTQLVELYVASFNRAADADGLDYWIGRFEAGMSLEDVASSFMDPAQAETSVLYPSNLSYSDYIDQVYQNVINRAPDAAGKAYWLTQLETGAVTRGNFILAVLNGAKADPPVDATPEEILLREQDNATLTNKTAVGDYFASLGLNDITLAADIMSGVTYDATTVTAAEDQVVAALRLQFADRCHKLVYEPASSPLRVRHGRRTR